MQTLLPAGEHNQARAVATRVLEGLSPSGRGNEVFDDLALFYAHAVQANWSEGAAAALWPRASTIPARRWTRRGASPPSRRSPQP